MIKNTKNVLKITLAGVITLLCVMVLAVNAQLSEVDLDARGGYYSGWVVVQQGVTARLYVSIRQFNSVEISIAPTQAPTEVVIRDPENKIIKTETFKEKRTVLINVEVKGVWFIEFKSNVDQLVNIEIKAFTAPPTYTTPQPTPKPPPVFPVEYVVVIVGASIVVVIAVVAVMTLRKKPTPPSVPTPPSPAKPSPPPVSAPSATSGETVLLDQKAAVSARETEIMLAVLELSDGRVIPVTSPRQIFGRADFERYVSPDILNYISRRHFMISLEPGGFFIEDLGSANGTTVNDTDIRGRGKVLLKSGDVIGIGGVIKLRFRAGS